MRKRDARSALAGVCLVMVLLTFYCRQRQSPNVRPGTENTSVEAQELIQNGGFEQPGTPVPPGWTWDLAGTGAKGKIAADAAQFHTGGASLKLEPNSKNGGDLPLAVSQLIPAGSYRGRKVTFSAYLKGQGGAVAVLAMLSIVNGKPMNLAGDGEPGANWALHRQEYTVPDDPSVQLLVICSASGQSGAVWFDDVSVMFGNPAATANAVAGPLEASVTVDAAQVVRQIPRSLFGANVEWTSDANMLWLKDQGKANPDLLRLTKDMGVSLIRYPGGYYSDFYHWRDGVGPVDKRPEVYNDATRTARSRPDFGTDEALDFAKQAGAELLITVNAGTGTAAEAADWVRYVNASSLRVRYWEVGNELYINDGSPLSKAITVDAATYAKRFREFAKAMKAADPRIKVGAIGGENRGAYAFVQYRDWDKTVLEQAGDQIDFLSVHNSYAPVSIEDRQSLKTVYQAMLAAPVLIAQNLATVAKQISDYAPSRASSIPIAVTEWGPLFQVDPKGVYAQHTKTLGSALFAASAFKTLIESPATQIANFHVLNDQGFMGWIGSTNDQYPAKPDWTPTARYYAFQLFSRHFGSQLLRSLTTAPTYDSDTVGAVSAVKGVPYLDVVSSLSADGRELSILAINKHFDNSIQATLDLRSFQPSATATAWTLNGSSIDANTGTKPIQIPGLNWGNQIENTANPRFSKGGPDEITFSSSAVNGVGTHFLYQFPAHSVTSIVLTRR